MMAVVQDSSTQCQPVRRRSSHVLKLPSRGGMLRRREVLAGVVNRVDTSTERIGIPGWEIPGYTELRVLGSGAVGDVVLARHDESGILVAVKYLRRDLLADPGFAATFRDEAAMLASLDDPNVVRLYEYIESPTDAVIVMELIDGVSVREILSDQGATTAEAALVVLQDSLLGLAAAR